jgi:hypothetical protein
VITIVLLASAVTLPVVLPAMAHRQVSEAARILQAVLAGARDSALRTGAPSGIRLLPDPAFPLVYDNTPGPTLGMISPNTPLAANRIIPIEAAPEYSEGKLNIAGGLRTLNMPYPAVNGGGNYPVLNNSTGTSNLLMVEESVLYENVNQVALNEPTSWFWNIRVGDQLQINGAGLWYTIVGPMTVTPQPVTLSGVTYSNPEMFVNVGPPQTRSPWGQVQPIFAPSAAVFPEFLFLVNGIDDNKNGWVDEGFDGVDNNSDGVIDDLGEWEAESWNIPSFVGLSNQSYTIRRRPAPSSNSREMALPTNVVIDLTTWNFALPERSQFPPGVLNPYTGYVDILVYPNGTVVPTTIYSTPSSFGMGAASMQFWLAERSDVVAPTISGSSTSPPYLPIGTISRQLTLSATPYNGARIQGEYRIVTLFTRTGQVSSDDNVEFDNPLNPANRIGYNPYFPFLAARRRIGEGL